MQMFSKKTQMGDPHGRSSTAGRLILNQKFKKHLHEVMNWLKAWQSDMQSKEKGKDPVQAIKVQRK